MNLRDLEYLVALAEHRHFSRAAAACFVSQPTLSTQLKKLERELGAPLVERGPGPVLLTAAGEEIAARAQAVLAGVDEIRAVAERATNPRTGVLTLGLFPTLGPYLLPHVIGRVRDALPNLRLRLVEEKTDELLSGLRAGRLDAVVVAVPEDLSGLASEPLFSEDFVLAVPAGVSVAEPAAPATMRELDVLLLDEGHCLRDQALSVCSLAGAREVGYRATSLETLRHMVAAGAGSTLLPRLSVSPPVAPMPGVRLVEFAEPRPHRDLVLVWRPSSPAAALMPELADLLRITPV